MSLTREDVLRELELLPAWQLRAPQIQAAAAPKALAEAAPAVATAPPALPVLRIILSEDARYLFLLSPLQTADEEALLQNILKALHVKPRVDTRLQNALDLGAHQAKIIIAMGESAAQLIGLQASKQADASQIEQTMFGAAIATFSPAHLLQNPHHKAHTWQDLCTAKLSVQSVL